MKKRVSQRTFSRKIGPRKALLKSQLRSLVLSGRIETTLAKAKTLSPAAEKIVTRARKGDLATRRHLTSLIGKEGAAKLMDEVAPRYKDRQGGYTRILKLAPRKSDQAKLALIEFV